jgi:hypothetical protein
MAHFTRRPGDARVLIRSGADTVASMLGAASTCRDRETKAAYLAAARLALARELARHVELQALLDAQEKELARTELTQLSLDGGPRE